MVFGCGIGRAGKENADALSRNPVLGAGEEHVKLELGVHVVQVSSVGDLNVTHLLDAELMASFENRGRIKSFELGVLPEDDKVAQKVTAEALYFPIVDGVLYFMDPKRGNKKHVSVPAHLQQQILQEGHGGGSRTFLRSQVVQYSVSSLVAYIVQGCSGLLPELC